MNAAKADKVRFAREQRHEPTLGETVLWRHLRRAQLEAKFRRQHPIEDFVLDFYCEEALLAVEVDGPEHAARAEYDSYRDERMQARGIRTLRFSALEAINHPGAVVRQIREAVTEARRGLTPGPSPKRRGEPG